MKTEVRMNHKAYSVNPRSLDTKLLADTTVGTRPIEDPSAILVVGEGEVVAIQDVFSGSVEWHGPHNQLDTEITAPSWALVGDVYGCKWERVKTKKDLVETRLRGRKMIKFPWIVAYDEDANVGEYPLFANEPWIASFTFDGTSVMVRLSGSDTDEDIELCRAYEVVKPGTIRIVDIVE